MFVLTIFVSLTKPAFLSLSFRLFDKKNKTTQTVREEKESRRAKRRKAVTWQAGDEYLQQAPFQLMN